MDNKDMNSRTTFLSSIPVLNDNISDCSQSKINFLEYEDTIPNIVQDLLGKVFHQVEGWCDNASSSICDENDLIASKMKPDKIDEDHLDKRLKYWQNYLKIRKKLCEKIMNTTGKDKSELLMYSSDLYRRREFTKKLLDYTDRLNSTKLLNHQPNKGKEIVCVPDVWETLNDEIKKLIENFDYVDIPSVIKNEQNIIDQFDNQFFDKWFKSDYFQKIFKEKQKDIQKILPHIPNPDDIDKLQIIGKKIDLNKKPEDVANRRESSMINDKKRRFLTKHVESDVGASFKSSSAHGLSENDETMKNIVKFDDIVLNASSKKGCNLIRNYVFESKLYKKDTKFVFTLENCGWKIFDFEWEQNDKKLPKIFNCSESSTPPPTQQQQQEEEEQQEQEQHLSSQSQLLQQIKKNMFKSNYVFFFNQENFKLYPGQKLNMEITFCPIEQDIFEEQWYLHTKPDLFTENKKIIINLFGYGYVNDNERTNYENLNSIENQIQENSIKNLSLNTIETMTKFIFPIVNNESLENNGDNIQIPFISNDVEKEIFESINPDYNYNEMYLNELKSIYKEIYYYGNPANFDSNDTANDGNGNELICESPIWNYDLLNLRNLILKINNEEKRKELFYKFIEIIHLMRKSSSKIDKLPLSSSSSPSLSNIVDELHTKQMYEDHKFILVKSVLASAIQSIDEIGIKLRNSIYQTEHNLDYDEIIINPSYSDEFLTGDSKSVAKEKKDNFDNVKGQTKNVNVDKFCHGDSKSIEEEKMKETKKDTDEKKSKKRKSKSKKSKPPNEEKQKSTKEPGAPYVIKAKGIKEKQDLRFEHAFYMNIYSHLGQAAEDIAGIIEGMENFY